MSNTKISNLEKKKKELEEELRRIQNGLDRSIDGVREDVTENLDPKNLIRKYPLPVVGGAFVLGLLLGKPKSTRRRYSSKNSKSLGSVIGKELRNALTKKAVSVLVDIIDDQLKSRKTELRE